MGGLGRCVIHTLHNPTRAGTEEQLLSVMQVYHEKQVLELRNQGVSTQNILEAHWSCQESCRNTGPTKSIQRGEWEEGASLIMQFM